MSLSTTEPRPSVLLWLLILPTVAFTSWMAVRTHQSFLAAGYPPLLDAVATVSTIVAFVAIGVAVTLFLRARSRRST